MKSLTIHPNATVVIAFDSAEERDSVRKKLEDTLPPEVHRRFKSTQNDTGGLVLSMRVQDISQPVTVTFEPGAPVPPPETPANRPGYERLKSLKEMGKEVPGANAEAHTEDNPTTSGVNLTQGVPGAVNNDPSTASNAGYEGSPAQALQSALELGGGVGPTPGGLTGPDKAARIGDAAPGTALHQKTGDDKPKDEKQDPAALAIHEKANQEEKPKAKEDAEPLKEHHKHYHDPKHKK